MICLRAILTDQETIDRVISQVSILPSLDRAVLSERVGAVTGKFLTAFIMKDVLQFWPGQRDKV